MTEAKKAPLPAVQDEVEQKYLARSRAFVAEAEAFSIQDDEDWDEAARAVRNVKRMQGELKDYWEPLRVSAKEAYDAVLGRKRLMMTPLDEAEKILRTKMADYVENRDREAREAGETMRREALAEKERRLEEAARAEAAGDTAAAEYARAEAEVLESTGLTGRVQSAVPRADGVTVSKSWEIVDIDPALVPDTFRGAELRPVDEKAVLRLIKDTKGMVEIPGVSFRERVSLTVRS